MSGGTDNLLKTQLAEDEAAPELSVNDATGEIDAALTEVTSKSFSGGNVTISDSELTRNIRLIATSVSVARDMTLGTTAVKRTIIIESAAANTATLTVKRGSGSFKLDPGESAVVTTDGTANGITGTKLSTQYDFYAFVSGVMTNNMTVLGLDAVRPFTLPINLTGSYAKAGTAATGSTTLTIKKNGSSIGTLVWAVSGTVATITFSAAVSFVATDILTIVGPASADATLADIRLSFKGQR